MSFLDCFEAKSPIEGKIAFFEAFDNANSSKALMCASLGWLTDHLANGQDIDVRKVLYLSGNEFEQSKKIQQFYSTSFGNVKMTELGASNEMSGFMHNLKIDSGDSEVAVPQIIFATQSVFFENLLSITRKFPPRKIYDCQDQIITLKDTIVVVDDAHVVEQHCKNSASVTLSACQLDFLIQNLESIAQDEDALILIRDQMIKFQKVFRASTPYNGEDGGYTSTLVHFRGDEIDSMFNPHYQKLMNNFKFKDGIDLHIDVFQFISHIFKFSDKSPFKMYITEKQLKHHQHSENCKEGKKCRTLELVCLDPSVVFKQVLILEPHTLLFKSTTMSPISQIKLELGIQESLEVSLPPSIEDFKFFARIVQCGAGGYFLNSSEHCRKDRDYFTSLGETILEILKITPRKNGVIIYFTSNELMSICISHWGEHLANGRSISIWDSFCENKDTFAVYPDSFGMDFKFTNLLLKLKEARRQGTGCCVLSALRSQLSEAENIHPFDQSVVIIIGVPYAPPSDAVMQLKKEHNNKKLLNREKSMSGEECLIREAYQKVRRVTDLRAEAISRHHGVLLMVDMRFNTKYLSPWIQDKIPGEKRFNELLIELKDFFNCIDQRVEWYNASLDPTQVSTCSTQFGEVKPWEFEKVRLEYNKLRKQNDRLEGNKKCFEESLERLKSQRDKLEKNLNELRLTEQQNNLDKEEADAKASVSETVNLIIRSQSISPRKRSYPD